MSEMNNMSECCTSEYPFNEPYFDINGGDEASYCSGSDSPGPFRTPKRRGRPITTNAARERSRVKTLRSAFQELQSTLPAVPPDTKLSKLDVLVLATTYIAHLMSALQEDGDPSQIFAANGFLHPVKKWPMRTRLYAGILSSTSATSSNKGDTRSQGNGPSWTHSQRRGLQ